MPAFPVAPLRFLSCNDEVIIIDLMNYKLFACSTKTFEVVLSHDRKSDQNVELCTLYMYIHSVLMEIMNES